MLSREVSRENSLYSLIIDELAYRVVRRIHGRARTRQPRAMPLFAPTTDLIGHRLISTGVFEHTQIEAIDALLGQERSLIDCLGGERDTFIDVGANIGFYTTRYARQFKRVLAIEANPITFDVLRSNVALLQSPNVSTICVGASDKQDYLPMKIPDDGVMGWSSFENIDESADRTVMVPVKTIDQIAAESAPTAAVSLMKIDVEGHEANVLRGSMGVLRRDRPMILYEQLNREAGSECADVLDSAGYKTFLAFTRKANILRPFSKCPVNADVIDPRKVDRCALICAY